MIIIALAVLAKLLYSPLYTIHWEANHRFEKEQEFRIIEKMALNPSPKDRVKIVDDYQSKLEDFKDLNVKFTELAPLEILCLKCNQTSILEENVFKCPKCESIEYKISQGEDLHLMRLVME